MAELDEKSQIRSTFPEPLTQNFAPDAEIDEEIADDAAAEAEWNDDPPVENTRIRFVAHPKDILPDGLIDPWWERQPDEPYVWWMRFLRFRNMGPSRNALAIYRAEAREKRQALPGVSSADIEAYLKTKDSAPQSWIDKRRRWFWDKRAQAWDRHRAESELNAIEGERARFIDEVRASERSSAKRLLDQAEKMLAFPISEQQAIQRDEQGNPVVVVVRPQKWSASDIATFLKTASQLNRLAADLETDRTAVVDQSAQDDPVITSLRERLQRRKGTTAPAKDDSADDDTD